MILDPIPTVATGQRYEQINPPPGYENYPEIIEVAGHYRLIGWWTVISNFPGRRPRPMPAATILNEQVYRLLPNHREVCWEDLGMQDISAGPVQTQEAFNAGYDAAMIRCRDAVQTCRAIAEGAGIMGDPETYSQYVRTMCSNAIAELTNPDGTPNS